MISLNDNGQYQMPNGATFQALTDRVRVIYDKFNHDTD